MNYLRSLGLRRKEIVAERARMEAGYAKSLKMFHRPRGRYPGDYRYQIALLHREELDVIVEIGVLLRSLL